MNHKSLAQLTPKEIVNQLDTYIVGQKEAKRNVAIALRNRWRRMSCESEMQKEISPNNILMIGSTGVGKTEIARRLAKIAHAPFSKVEASKFTEVGYVGRDVESMVRDLVDQAVHLVKTEKKELLLEKTEQNVTERILDILIPLNPENSDPKTQEASNYTREIFKKKLLNGELDSKIITVEIQNSNTPKTVGVLSGNSPDEMMMNIEEMMSRFTNKGESKTKKITVAEAKELFKEDESSKLLDMDEIGQEAIKKAENLGIIFIDEIDKIALVKSNAGGGGNPDISRGGVQRDLLPIVEGCSVKTKYGMINTDHILFIAAGAFHVAKPSDLIPELQGRFPIRVELQSLSEDDFVQILKKPNNALTKQYQALLKTENIQLDFEEDSLVEIAKIAFQANEQLENIGARRLQTIMNQLLQEFMFDIPDTLPQNNIIKVNSEMVKEKLGSIIKNKDLSQYIL